MKKIFALTLALVMALSLAACGGKNDPKPSGSDKEPSASQQEPAATPDPGASQTDDKGSEDKGKKDWQQTLQDDYGITVTMPDGWTVDEEKLALMSAQVNFVCEAPQEEAVAFLESIFSELKNVAVGDITESIDGKAYGSITEANAAATKTYYVNAFNVPLNADGSKSIYFKFNWKTKDIEGTENWNITEVEIYLTKEGNWN